MILDYSKLLGSLSAAATSWVINPGDLVSKVVTAVACGVATYLAIELIKFLRKKLTS